jgi:hypothetical protein
MVMDDTPVKANTFIKAGKVLSLRALIHEFFQLKI